MRHIQLLALLAFAAALPAQQPAPAAATPISRDSLALLVRERVQQGRSSGIVVGVIRPDGSRDIVAYGDERPGKSLDANTVFEIGSITKVFTGILLADMVNRGEVRLDQPVAELLPGTVHVPTYQGKQITLGDLSSQISGLPRLPSNIKPADASNPYADYTVEQLYDFLSHHELRRAPGAQYEYSNLGVGLLGHALALRAGTPYEQLVRERILQPLGMHSTAITLDASLRPRFADGHDISGRRVSAWDIPTLAGAGGLRSSLDDMLRFAQAVLIPPDNALGRAIALAERPRFTVNGVMSLGLNWHRNVMAGDTVVWHNGGTGGFHSFLGVNPRTRTAVVLLENAAANTEDIPRHVLVAAMPLTKFTPHTEVQLPASLLAEYAGTYRVGPQVALQVSVQGSALAVAIPGQPTLPVFAEARDRFFYRVVEAQLVFERDATGAVNKLVLLQGGARTEALRVKE